MNAVITILQSKEKPKEKVALLADKAKKDKKLLNELVENFEAGSVAEKGNCMEVMECVSHDEPDIIIPYLDFVIENLDNDAPKVKWESARVIGNLASRCPDKVARSTKKLFLNTKDDGTVVRWSAAFALTEIAKFNSRLRKELVKKFNQIVKEEDNNGVRNVYLKALKVLE